MKNNNLKLDNIDIRELCALCHFNPTIIGCSVMSQLGLIVKTDLDGTINVFDRKDNLLYTNDL